MSDVVVVVNAGEFLSRDADGTRDEKATKTRTLSPMNFEDLLRRHQSIFKSDHDDDGGGAVGCGAVSLDGSLGRLSISMLSKEMDMMNEIEDGDGGCGEHATMMISDDSSASTLLTDDEDDDEGDLEYEFFGRGYSNDDGEGDGEDLTYEEMQSIILRQGQGEGDKEEDDDDDDEYDFFDGSPSWEPAGAAGVTDIRSHRGTTTTRALHERVLSPCRADADMVLTAIPSLLYRVRYEPDADDVRDCLAGLVELYGSVTPRPHNESGESSGSGSGNAASPPLSFRALKGATMSVQGPSIVVGAMIKHARNAGLVSQAIACLGKMTELDDQEDGGDCNDESGMSFHVADADGIEAVVEGMRLHSDCFLVQLYGCMTLHRITKNNEANVMKLVYGGGVTAILRAREDYYSSESIVPVASKSLARVTTALANAVFDRERASSLSSSSSLPRGDADGRDTAVAAAMQSLLLNGGGDDGRGARGQQHHQEGNRWRRRRFCGLRRRRRRRGRQTEEEKQQTQRDEAILYNINTKIRKRQYD